MITFYIGKYMIQYAQLSIYWLYDTMDSLKDEKGNLIPIVGSTSIKSLEKYIR